MLYICQNFVCVTFFFLIIDFILKIISIIENKLNKTIKLNKALQSFSFPFF